MSNNSIRINTTPNTSDKFIKVNLKQEFDFIEILSLKISQEDVYRNFCADYGVVTGRVIVNNGFGVPNAKVSIFIPIDDIDKNDAEISSLYPFEIVTDKDLNGVRYNLLPKTSTSENECFTPVGTLPDKREILDNPELLEIYNKYYKFTTTTNYAGDYMLFGVPLGTYVIHIDADISDIGIISQRPYDNISQGMSKSYFDTPTKYKGGTNLDKLIQIKSINSSVNVQPFWGNFENCEIGINRVDLDLNYNVIPNAIFMGSIFGDNEKNSVNKNCIPRRNMGDICDQVSNEGTIEMIRETIYGTIESFDVEGGRVIDDSGVWAYQIPMNLDYMITDEQGRMILSNDPNKGIPTRASVRFRIGMDQTGGEGRLRTRAKYLVPNNPNDINEIDYEFNENTKSTSFRTLYWNKIYSVSNFIGRYQRNTILNGGNHTRHATMIKDVDSCGDKTPFPFNRITAKFNPLFFIICLVIKIVGSLVWMINYVITPIINGIMFLLNIIVNAICGILKSIVKFINKIFSILGRGKRTIDMSWCQGIDYVPCATIKCPFDEGYDYAPGCHPSSDIPPTKFGFEALTNEPAYYPGDGKGHHVFSNGLPDLVGLDDCIAYQMASAMNLFKYDFHNDWVNGTLYSFLLKYKKRSGREKFCEYECSNLPSGGVDGNNDGKSDNDCVDGKLLDTNYYDEKSVHDINIREGLIKKVGDEFYYAATTHDIKYKMFATEVINLGSVFECDWQGVAKIQPYLVETTYNMPPGMQELDNNNVDILTTGVCDNDGNTLGLFFGISCLGINMNKQQCNNLRHICEFGVELDEQRIKNNTKQPPDGIIGLTDLDLDDKDKPKLFRDVFAMLNINRNTWKLGLPLTTNFNLNDRGDYLFASNVDNGADYITFRGYDSNADNAFHQPKHSYFFYFGIAPGKTALHKMNNNYFNVCKPQGDKDFNLEIFTTGLKFGTTNTGTATINLVGGNSPFIVEVSGPNIYKFSGSTGVDNTIPIIYLGGLHEGTYNVKVTDDKGFVITKTFTVSGVLALYANAYVSSNCISSTVSNGEITISSVGGGSGTYFYTLHNSTGGVVRNKTAFTTIPTVIDGLAKDVGPNPNNQSTGYTLTISDSANNTIILKNLKVDGLTPLTLTATTKDNICYDDKKGVINLITSGGKTPLTFNTTGPKTGNKTFNSPKNIMSGLTSGVYISTVTDSLGATETITSTIISQIPEMEIEAASSTILNQQCDESRYKITIKLNKPIDYPSNTITFEVNGGLENSDGTEIWLLITTSYDKAKNEAVFYLPNTYILGTLIVRMKDNKELCYSEEIYIDIREVRLAPNLVISEPKTQLPQTSYQANFAFNISHLVYGATYRLPYVVKYDIISGGMVLKSGVEIIKSSNTPTTIKNVSLTEDIYSYNVKLTVTDDVGCTATYTLNEIYMY